MKSRLLKLQAVLLITTLLTASQSFADERICGVLVYESEIYTNSEDKIGYMSALIKADTNNVRECKFRSFRAIVGIYSDNSVRAVVYSKHGTVGVGRNSPPPPVNVSSPDTMTATSVGTYLYYQSLVP